MSDAPRPGSGVAGLVRARILTGGFGPLSLAALIFAMLRDAEAADPNVTLLDDDHISYKDLEHGTFELVTKEAVPRHILVDDPGETIVVNKIGSTISVNQLSNSTARMEELQAAQQDAWANLAKGFAPTGSGTPPSADSLPLEPINFTEPDAPAPQHPLPIVLPSVITVPEITIIRLAPTLDVKAGPVEIDTSVFDNFSATSGSFSASSLNGEPLIFGISGGTVGTTVVAGATYDVAKAGSYGTLYLNSASGAYTFVPNSGAINALTAPTIEDFVITVSDGSLSTSQIFTIDINGVNDAAIISGATAGSSIEAGAIANSDAGIPVVTGRLTDTDVDNAPDTFTAVSSPKPSTGGYGTFTMTSSGAWTYTLDNTNSKVQALNVGDTMVDAFTVTTIDGTPQAVMITIVGSNDAAVVSGDTAGSVIESAPCKPGVPIAAGTLVDSDVDNPPNTFTAACAPAPSAGGYGTFTINSAGVWTYALDEDNCAVRALRSCDTLTDTFTVMTIDGTPQVVTITIHGAGFQEAGSTAAAAPAQEPAAKETPKADDAADAAPGANGGSNDDAFAFSPSAGVLSGPQARANPVAAADHSEAPDSSLALAAASPSAALLSGEAFEFKIDPSGLEVLRADAGLAPQSSPTHDSGTATYPDGHEAGTVRWWHDPAEAMDAVRGQEVSAQLIHQHDLMA